MNSIVSLQLHQLQKNLTSEETESSLLGRIPALISIEIQIQILFIDSIPFLRVDHLPQLILINEKLTKLSSGKSEWIKKISTICENILDTTHATIEILPEDMLCEIFSRTNIGELKKLSNTCKAFRAVIRNPTYFPRLCQQYLSHISIHRFPDFFKNNKKLIHKFEFDIPKYMGRNKLPLFDDSLFKAILKECSDLRTLNLEGCLKITNPCFLQSQQHLIKLEELNISSCSQFNDKTIAAIVSQCTKLKKFEARQSLLLGNLTIASLVNCTNLNTIHVRSCDRFSETSFLSIVDKFPELRDLNISNCTQFSEDMLKTIFEKLKNLEILDISNCTNVTDEVLKSISQNCQKLKHLEIYGCKSISFEGLNLILGCCTKLQKIRISKTPITNDEINSLKESFPSIHFTR